MRMVATTSCGTSPLANLSANDANKANPAAAPRLKLLNMRAKSSGSRGTGVSGTRFATWSGRGSRGSVGRRWLTRCAFMVFWVPGTTSAPSSVSSGTLRDGLSRNHPYSVRPDHSFGHCGGKTPSRTSVLSGPDLLWGITTETYEAEARTTSTHVSVLTCCLSLGHRLLERFERCSVPV